MNEYVRKAAAVTVVFLAYLFVEYFYWGVIDNE